MSLLTRLVDPLEGEEKIPVHQFVGGLREIQRGHVTAGQFATFYELTPGEEAAATAWYMANLVPVGSSVLETEEVEDVLLLGETGAYSLATVQSRLNL